MPYQTLLAEALAAHEVEVSWLKDYRRGLPLWRLMQRLPESQILHLHWPEAYYRKKGDVWDWFRGARFPLDLRLAIRGRALAVTAHNLHAHNLTGAAFEDRNTRAAFALANVVFAHSEAARAILIQTFSLPPERVVVIAHGDLSVTLGPPATREEARRQLGLSNGRYCLMFGTVEPYKGIEEMIDFWRAAKPEGSLVIVGRPCTPEYGEEIAQHAEGIPGVEVHLGWLADERLRLWLSATDCVLFNYREIFTSGAANLTRAYGVPTLLPARLTTVVLDEPNPRVRRFTDPKLDLAEHLNEVWSLGPGYDEAAGWREETAWARVAATTAAAYRAALR